MWREFSLCVRVDDPTVAQSVLELLVQERLCLPHSWDYRLAPLLSASLERVLVPSRDTGMQEDGHTYGVYGLCSGEVKFGSSGIYFLMSYCILTL